MKAAVGLYVVCCYLAKVSWLIVKRLIWAYLLVGLLFGVGVGTVEASDGMRGQNCEIREDEYINHDFYFMCSTLVVRGVIDGDLIGLASEVTIEQEGRVTGDVWMMGGQLVIQGMVNDDVRFAGIDLDITEQASFPSGGTDITAAAVDTEISEGTNIPGDFLMFGIQATIRGDIGGNIDFQGQTLLIGGRVGGSVDAIVGDSREEPGVRTFPVYSVTLEENYGLYINDSSRIDGHLKYEAAQRANIPQNVVSGPTNYEQLLERDDITRAEQPETFITILRNYLTRVIRDFIALVVIGLLALHFSPKVIVNSAVHIRNAFIPAFSWGLILFVMTFPFALLMIFVTVLSILIVTLLTLGALLIMTTLFLVIVNLSVFTTVAFLFIYLGRVVACFILGYSLIQGMRYYLESRQAEPDDPPVYIPPLPERYRWVALALGVGIFALLLNLPLPSPFPTFELILEAVVAFTGLGAIFMYARDKWYTNTSQVDRKSWLVARPRISAPLLEEEETSLGLDNLPEGFSGFYEDE